MGTFIYPSVVNNSLAVQNKIYCIVIGMMNSIEPMVSVEFEVYGKVQGVYFTKYCKEMCEEFDISGWVKNSKRGTILGKLQGSRSNIERIILWLSNTGSPGSQVDHCDLTNWQNLAKRDFTGFTIRF